MTKPQLQEILSGSFSKEGWLDVLRDIFSVKRLHQEPQAIALPANDKAEAAFELGSLDTSDDRLIGLYLVEVKPNVWLEENRVGLRNLLRNIYKYDVDGALVVFTQKNKWRLSFVSEIRAANDEGELIDQVTEPKRYTYFLGEGEKVKTPTDRIYSLRNKPLGLEDIRHAFSVEALNEAFYKIVARQFYKLVGATEGKGTKTITHKRTLQLPSISADDRKTYQEFAVRLIGRTVFCWFLKMKKPDHATDGGIPLLPEFLLSSEAVRNNKGYYHNVLELLFFQTLNTQMDQRRADLPKGTETIPFLNGGLFEPQTDDFYKPDPQTGLSKNLNTLVIPDEWFEEFFEKLEQFNFTIDENSVVDVEVSVDPEMLGRIFENLLAEIDPDSGETARKATGSFYTPREIVDYMASESLVQYLVNKTGMDEKQLHPLFRLDQEVKFSKSETNSILDALDKLKILDPACGSGAFPIGVLQKIVMALQKLDPQSIWWKARQIEKVDNAYIRQQIKTKLDAASVEYARKIGIIQNSLYGVDIQPVAAEISKLRCFLTLIVDENIDESKPNRGVEPLPNLEFKFVTADTLTKLPSEEGQQNMFSNYEELQKLKELRKDYLQSYGEEKEQIKTEFLNTQKSIFKQQLSFFDNPNSRAYKLSVWNPFSHDKSDWFDPEWMFGVKTFDVIVGNPPYVDIKNLPNEQVKNFFQDFDTTQNRINLYSVFIERSMQFLDKDAILTFINPNSILVNSSYKKIREHILNNVVKIVKLPDSTFQTAIVETIILILSTSSRISSSIATKHFKNDAVPKFDNLQFTYYDRATWRSDKEKRFNIYVNEKSLKTLSEIEKTATPLRELVDFSLGITPYDKYKGHSKELIENREFHAESKLSDEYVPLLAGKNIHRYYVSKGIDEYLKYGEWLGAPREKRFFENEKIIVRQILSGHDLKIVAAYSDEPHYFTQIGFSLTHKQGIKTNLKFLTALLNSALMSYYHKIKFLDLEKYVFQKILIANCKDFPIRVSSKEKSFEILVDYIIFLNRLNPNQPINDYVPNSHLIQQFEEIIDAMVYELYFEEDFKKADIEFIKYVERDFPSIDGLKSERVKQVIHESYQRLRQKENELRNNLKLMDIRLRDLIMPIKTAH